MEIELRIIGILFLYILIYLKFKGSYSNKHDYPYCHHQIKNKYDIKILILLFNDFKL